MSVRLSMNETPSDKQLVSACYYYRHDFGLLSEKEQRALMDKCRSWWMAIAKEVTSPSKHPMVTATTKSLVNGISVDWAQVSSKSPE